MRTYRTFVNASRSFEVQWEEAWPVAIGLTVAVFFLIYGDDIFSHAISKDWHVDALYNSIFALTAASSAFLFSLYTYAKTADVGALRLIRTSKMFKRASGYIIRNVIICFLTSILTVPFTVVVPTPTEDGLALLVFSFWAGLSVTALAGSVRSLVHFYVILDAADGTKYRE